MGNVTIKYGTESSKYGATIDDDDGRRQDVHISNAKEVAQRLAESVRDEK